MARVWRPMWRSVLGAVARKYQNADPGVGGGFTPALLFLASEQGAWYDPSDMSTMFQDAAGTTPVTAVEQPVGLILDKSGRGNHAFQATAASRPVLSARKNLLTRTEDLTHSDWIKVTTSVSMNGAVATLTPSATASTHSVINNIGALAGTQTISGEVKPDGYTKVAFKESLTTGHHASFDLTGAGSVLNMSAANATIALLPDGYYRLSMTVITTGSVGRQLSILAPAYTSGDPNSSSFAGDGTSGVLVRYPQAESGSTATRYQRVTTNTDYDTVGFYHYAKLDRVDDNMTAAAGGGGTTGICVCASIRAGGAGDARTIWSDRGTNTGYRLSINASNQLVLSAGNGSAHTEVVGPTVTAGTDYVVTGWHDGTNLNVQLNAGAATSAAFGTATAGTAGFTIGKDNGAATGYYGDRIYEIVYRKDDTSSAGDRTSLITYMAKQAGITL